MTIIPNISIYLAKCNLALEALAAHNINLVNFSMIDLVAEVYRTAIDLHSRWSETPYAGLDNYLAPHAGDVSTVDFLHEIFVDPIWDELYAEVNRFYTNRWDIWVVRVDQWGTIMINNQGDWRAREWERLVDTGVIEPPNKAKPKKQLPPNKTVGTLAPNIQLPKDLTVSSYKKTDTEGVWRREIPVAHPDAIGVRVSTKQVNNNLPVAYYIKDATGQVLVARSNVNEILQLVGYPNDKRLRLVLTTRSLVKNDIVQVRFDSVNGSKRMQNVLLRPSNRRYEQQMGLPNLTVFIEPVWREDKPANTELQMMAKVMANQNLDADLNATISEINYLRDQLNRCTSKQERNLVMGRLAKIVALLNDLGAQKLDELNTKQQELLDERMALASRAGSKKLSKANAEALLREKDVLKELESIEWQKQRLSELMSQI